MMVNDPAPPPPGKYVVYDRITPPLKAGDYKLVVEQEITSSLKTPGGGIKTGFRVTGPRFKLPGGEVHMHYPPRDLPNAPTYSHIPFITLQTRTLPWTHSPFIGNETPAQFGANQSSDVSDYPSMILLVLKESEITNSNGDLTIYTGEDGDTVDNILSTAISKGMTVEDGSEMVDYLEIPDQTLNNIVPTLDEALLLAHARQVNPVDKEACGTDEDGWFSVVMSNRVLEPNEQYYCCLVSIEGRLSEGVLHSLGTIKLTGSIGGSSSKTVTNKKLVLLHHWKFRTASDGGDFESRMQNLNVRISESGSSNLEQGSIAPIKELVNTDVVVEPLLLGNDSVPGMTDNSYLLTQLNHVDGIPEDALYRGPAIAVPEDHNVKTKPYSNSDEALGYVDELGIWDISHSAAFELGRLIALSDASFTKNLKLWIAKDIQERKLQLAQNNLKDRGIALELISTKLESISANIQQVAVKIDEPRLINYIHDDYDSYDISEIRTVQDGGIANPDENVDLGDNDHGDPEDLADPGNLGEGSDITDFGDDLGVLTDSDITNDGVSKLDDGDFSALFDEDEFNPRGGGPQ